MQYLLASGAKTLVSLPLGTCQDKSSVATCDNKVGLPWREVQARQIRLGKGAASSKAQKILTCRSVIEFRFLKVKGRREHVTERT